MKRLNFNIKDRKILYMVLGIILVSAFSLTIVYAALSVTLNIMGNAEVVASGWEIKLANPKVKNGSVTTDVPTISGNTLTFNTTLTTPGDYYEFTVDVVNNGTIDAMIDSVVKNPELTSEQAKYLKYEITYQNGEAITSKQLLSKKTTMPIKVRLEYRKDLVASDLPTTNSNLSLSLTLNYIQSDGSGSSVNNNGEIKLINVVSGDGATKGNEVCIKDECFYVISSTDTTITMIAKYNLYVGNSVAQGWVSTPLANPTGIQDSRAVGHVFLYETRESLFPIIGVTAFSSKSQKGVKYNDYEGSIVEQYVTNYSDYLSGLGIIILESRLIRVDELNTLGCFVQVGPGCSNSPYSWIYSTTYWTSTAEDSDDYLVFCISTNGELSSYDAESDYDTMGVRPVIVISKDYL